jgi:uroporphyrinogen-III synthase
MSDRTAAPLVVITRDAREEDGLAEALAKLGARSRALPTIRIAPPRDERPLLDALADLGSFDWVLFTSAHAVAATCGQPDWEQRWHGLERRPAIAAVGQPTAARLAAFGVTADLVADQSGGEGLARVVAARAGSLGGVRMLWPRSDIAGRTVHDLLVAGGAVVADPEAYRTEPVRPAAIDAFVSDLDAGRIDAVAFLSPSSAQGLAAALPGGTLRMLAGRTLVAAIGPTTGAALAALDAPAGVVPATPAAAALAEAIVRHLARPGVMS